MDGRSSLSNNACQAAARKRRRPQLAVRLQALIRRNTPVLAVRAPASPIGQLEEFAAEVKAGAACSSAPFLRLWEWKLFSVLTLSRIIAASRTSAAAVANCCRENLLLDPRLPRARSSRGPSDLIRECYNEVNFSWKTRATVEAIVISVRVKDRTAAICPTTRHCRPGPSSSTRSSVLSYLKSKHFVNPSWWKMAEFDRHAWHPSHFGRRVDARSPRRSPIHASLSRSASPMPTATQTPPSFAGEAKHEQWWDPSLIEMPLPDWPVMYLRPAPRAMPTSNPPL